MSRAAWKAAAALADLCMVAALLASIRAGSAALGWLTVVPLIAFSAFAQVRAEKAERGGSS